MTHSWFYLSGVGWLCLFESVKIYPADFSFQHLIKAFLFENVSIICSMHFHHMCNVLHMMWTEMLKQAH